MRDTQKPASPFTGGTANLEKRADGTSILRNILPFSPTPRTLVDALDYWANTQPQHIFINEKISKNPSAWTGITFDEARIKARHIGDYLLQHGAGPTRPVAVLSGNSIAHAMVILGALYVGVPVASLSPAYSTASGDRGRLRKIMASLNPAVIFADDITLYATAINYLRLDGIAVPVLANHGESDFDDVHFLSTLTAGDTDDAVGAARAAVNGDTVAKILFTSGSTGNPKGVINTHGMWSANQQAIEMAWPFLRERPPVLLDWLPWSHTFGGNHNFGLVLIHGGTLYIDDGRATDRDIGRTIENLRVVSPTLYFNVPKGYDLLVSELENDAQLSKQFFAHLSLLKSASAALPGPLYRRLQQLSTATLGHAIPIANGWGATETAPTVTMTPMDNIRSDSMGIPLPGNEVKLIPWVVENGKEKYEMRVRGKNVFPGYWMLPQESAKAFDEEGFYRMGDLGSFVDPDDLALGIKFEGRVAEEFKLLTGTWVKGGPLRMTIIEALDPLVRDVVIAGENRDYVAALIFLNWSNCRRFIGAAAENLTNEALANHPLIIAKLQLNMKRLAGAGTGSSTFIRRALIEIEAPNMDHGESTDKGYINQRGVLNHRMDRLELLYAEPPSQSVLSID